MLAANYSIVDKALSNSTRNHNVSNEEPLRIGTVGTVVMTTVSVGIVLLNAAILITTVCNKKLHSASYYFYASFTLAGLLVGLVTLPVLIALTNNPEKFHGYWSCVPVTCLPTFVLVSFMLNMLVTSFDLHYKVVHPFKYDRKMTKRRSFALIVVIWMFSSLISFSPILGWNNYWQRVNDTNFTCSQQYICTFSFFAVILYVIIVPCIVFIVFFNGRVIYIAKRAVRHIERTRAQSANSATGKFKASQKSTITLLVILFFILVFWLPFLVLLHITFLCPDCIGNYHIAIGMLVALGSAAMGPITSVLRHREYRQTVGRICSERLRVSTTRRQSDTGSIGSRSSNRRIKITSSGRSSPKHKTKLPASKNKVDYV